MRRGKMKINNRRAVSRLPPSPMMFIARYIQTAGITIIDPTRHYCASAHRLRRLMIS